MKHLTRTMLVLGALVAVVPIVVHAHFRLLEPASWIVEDDRGDPQKAGPCGGTNADYGKPTFAVTKAAGGSKLHVKVQETIYHPGHFRIALAVNSPLELPPDPKTVTESTDRGLRSVSFEVMNPVQPPVLADNLWDHHAKFDAPQETDVMLPNISCKRCTLQISMFMEEHGVNNPGMFTYHHCANLEITPDKSKPIDKAWPAERIVP